MIVMSLNVPHDVVHLDTIYFHLELIHVHVRCDLSKLGLSLQRLRVTSPSKRNWEIVQILTKHT